MVSIAIIAIYLKKALSRVVNIPYYNIKVSVKIAEALFGFTGLLTV